MKLLIDNLNNEVVFIAPDFELDDAMAIAKEEDGKPTLILGDRNSGNSRVETSDSIPSDFNGRNYTYENGNMVKKS